ncbi:hypothetical protein [Paenibacillus sp. FSL W8-0194]|uniref:hypothetical protein n=1 Tax=Paenibacillus sp. FSL W8-0194 TaxID=2921711 RepID=UPI0030D7F31A
MRKQFIFGLVILAILTLWGASWYFIPLMYSKEELGAGTFGDMFGAVNALFSGLAFAGLIYTISVQRQELQAQVSAIKMQTDELSLQRAAVQMQTEELALQRKAIEMQTKETARSADQLESQRELLYFQLVVAHVNELIAIKNKKISFLNFEITNKGFTTTHSGIKAITELVRKNMSSDASYYPVLNEFMNSFFYILQYIVDSELEDRLKDMVGKLIFVEVSKSEVHVLYGMNQNNQHNLMLLNRFELHKKIQSDEWTLK